jgi:hypothetical protein
VPLRDLSRQGMLGDLHHMPGAYTHSLFSST